MHCCVLQVTKSEAYIECFSNKPATMRRLGACTPGGAGKRGISLDRDLSQLFFGKLPRAPQMLREEPWYKSQRTDAFGTRRKAEKLLDAIVVQLVDPAVAAAAAADGMAAESP